MFKKSLKLLLLAIILVPAMLLSACTMDLTSCRFGACYINFESWDGVGPSDFVLTPGDQLDSSKFYDATKPGYNFVCWCYDKELTRPTEFPMIASHGSFTYYAKYELDEEYFTNLNHVVSWTNGQEDVNADMDELSGYAQDNVLLDKTNNSYELTSITLEAITDTPGQGFMVNIFNVYDEMGRRVEDKNPDQYVFEPKVKPASNETFRYVLRITSQRAGEYRIKIDGKTPV